LGVLADVIEKVQGHVIAAAPVQISFITHSNEYYEIIYVGLGMEAMVAASFEMLLAAKRQSSNYMCATKLIVIIEDKRQMTKLRFQGITLLALIQPDGSFSYFNGS